MLRPLLLLSLGLAVAHDANDAKGEDDDTALLQVKSTVSMSYERTKQPDGFAFVHMPYNFGNTITKVAMVGHTMDKWTWTYRVMNLTGLSSFAIPSRTSTWAEINAMTQEGGQIWGHVNPDLQVTSNVTGCPLYLTPPKYWPTDIAEKYIGGKPVVSVLRDPYEKLVAQFRGAMADYGGSVTAETMETCDVNAAVKRLLKNLDSSGDLFQGGCANIPQSEFFDGPYGITDPIDNWLFPKSANEKFAKYGYPYNIRQSDILHVELCPESWSYDFDAETRDLVKKIYKKDFELICSYFGRCDVDATTCIQGVQAMCPESRFEWNETSSLYCPRPGQEAEKMHLSMRDECSWPWGR